MLKKSKNMIVFNLMILVSFLTLKQLTANTIYLNDNRLFRLKQVIFSLFI